MIKWIENGNIFDSEMKTIVNPVNTVGVAGAGLALQFRERYPETFKKYKNVCDNNLFHVGQLMLCEEKGRSILMFPTKEDWKNPSQMRYIKEGLTKFVNTYKEKKIESIAFPVLGAGRGKLSAPEVMDLMNDMLCDLDIPVEIYYATPDFVR